MTVQSRILPQDASELGLKTFDNLGAPLLYEEAIRRGEGRVAAHGALVVETGPHTGRSAQDKFIVRDRLTESAVWWDANQSMSREDFDRLHADMRAHAEAREIFSQDLHACADPEHRLNIRVYAELAWHALFIRHLLIRPRIPRAGRPTSRSSTYLPSRRTRRDMAAVPRR